jgi:kanamycin kinase
MKLTPIKINPHDYPAELQPILANAKLYDSSCSPEAKVIYIDKDDGYFLKSAPKGTLEREFAMTRYFHGKGMSANVLAYISDERDWLLTEKIHGDDCTADKYCENPKRLCDTLARRLALLHSLDFSDCPVPNHTELYISKVNYDNYERNLFPETVWISSKQEAQAIVEKSGRLLQTDTLLQARQNRGFAYIRFSTE